MDDGPGRYEQDGVITLSIDFIVQTDAVAFDPAFGMGVGSTYDSDLLWLLSQHYQLSDAAEGGAHRQP